MPSSLIINIYSKLLSNPMPNPFSRLNQVTIFAIFHCFLPIAVISIAHNFHSCLPRPGLSVPLKTTILFFCHALFYFKSFPADLCPELIPLTRTNPFSLFHHPDLSTEANLFPTLNHNMFSHYLDIAFKTFPISSFNQTSLKKKFFSKFTTKYVFSFPLQGKM